MDTDGIAVGYTPQYEGHPPISVGQFPNIVDRLHANDNYMFSQEYDVSGWKYSVILIFWGMCIIKWVGVQDNYFYLWVCINM